MNVKTIAAVAALVLGLAALPVPTEARCAISRLVVEPLTPLAQPLPRDAHLVLALRPRSGGRTNATFGSVTIGTEGVAGGNLALATPIAPGLARVSLAGMPPGRHTLRGVSDVELPFEIEDRALPAPPPAPRVSSITVTDHGRGRRSVSGAVDAPGAIAFVVADGATAIAYGLPGAAGAPASLLPFGRCSSRPPGFRVIDAGQSVTVRAIDAAGQLSPPSAAVTAR